MRLTRVTRIFQLSAFTKFALAACYRPLRAWGGAKTPASASCGRGRGPSAGRAVLCYLSPCIFPVINRSASKNCSMHPLVVEGGAGGSLHVFVYGPAGDDGAHHAAFELGLVEGRVLAFRFEFRGVEHPGHVGIEHDHVRGAALPQRSGREA